MRELKVHLIALTIAILGPLINSWLSPLYSPLSISPYVYWGILLSIYIGILIPFISKSLITLARLVILGITVEDFFSALWKSLLTGKQFLPFCNWYAQYFPFFNVLGEPTPYLPIPRWYFLAILAYALLTVFQYRKKVRVWLKSTKIRGT